MFLNRNNFINENYLDFNTKVAEKVASSFIESLRIILRICEIPLKYNSSLSIARELIENVNMTNAEINETYTEYIKGLK